MNNEEKMLQSVLSDDTLITDYKYIPEEYTKMTTAKYSPNYVVAIIADIIENIKDGKESKDLNKSLNKNIYNKIVDRLIKDI